MWYTEYAHPAGAPGPVDEFQQAVLGTYGNWTKEIFKRGGWVGGWAGGWVGV